MGQFGYHFAGGVPFFIGLGVVLLAALLSTLGRWWPVRMTVRLIALIGVVLVAASATPLPAWAYAAWGALVVAWLILQGTAASRVLPSLLRGVVGVSCVVLALIEMPYHARPSVSLGPGDRLCVIGDSISSGLRAEEKTWPELLAELRGRPVENLARPGATLLSANGQAGRVGPGPAVVLLEIGGNDLLASRSADEFATHLRRLLEALRQRGRTLVMFELPLPPFENAYGAAQRRLAEQFGVTLIPKRLFAGILGAPGCTVDGVHLSPKGHRRMADLVDSILE